MEIVKPNFRKAKVKAEDYVNDATTYVIHGWMVKRLKLKGNEKDIFAIIHSFSQNEVGYFYGSKQYLAKYVSCDVSTVKNVLSSLQEKGFVTRYGKEYTGSDQRVYYVSNVDPEKLIKGEHTLETYKKIAEMLKKQRESSGGENSQVNNSPSDNTPTPSEEDTKPGVDNGHNNNSNTKYIFKDVVVTDKEIEDKIYCAILTSEEYISDITDNEFKKSAKETSLSMIEMAKQLSMYDKNKFMNVSENEILKIYNECFKSKHNMFGSFKNADGYVKSRIQKALLSQ